MKPAFRTAHGFVEGRHHLLLGSEDPISDSWALQGVAHRVGRLLIAGGMLYNRPVLGREVFGAGFVLDHRFGSVGVVGL